MASDIYTIKTEIDAGLCYLWQYDKAEKLVKLMQAKENFYKINVSGFFDDYYENIFNINTADTFGLELWGRFFGVSRPHYYDEDLGQEIFFTDDQYRTVIKGRVMLMNSNCSIPSINAYTEYLFPGKIVYTFDYQDMSLRMVFYYNPSLKERAIINLPGFLPRPAGVDINYVIIPPDEVFGFEGSLLSNFDNSVFFA